MIGILLSSYGRPATAGSKMLVSSSMIWVNWPVYAAIERKVKPASRMSEPTIRFSEISTALA